MQRHAVPARQDGRVIVHFDYDCFYASVFEAKNPALKSLPFAVQQKQIIVTCNYEARRRGLHKLQLITDAKRICPDVIIELGEDISRFRDVSKELYNFIKTYSWNGRVERLGFDEIWIDVTDVVEYNIALLNRHDLVHSYFHTSQDDPASGFAYDASTVAGSVFPLDYDDRLRLDDPSQTEALRLCLGSHFARHIRLALEQHKGYTSTVGIATTKLISKLVGNLNKPRGQTVLMPPLEENTMAFVDTHEIGKVPGIGFKMARKLREFVLSRACEVDDGLIYGGTRETVTVADVRRSPKCDPLSLEKLLAGPGSSHGLGYRVWCLLHGVDDTEVAHAKATPSQISIEDSYIRLDTMPELVRELENLAKSLITRMRVDLLEAEAPEQDQSGQTSNHEAVAAGVRWLAHPRTLRLTTRPRQPLQADGTRIRSFKRISHSAPLPTFVFALGASVESLASKLVHETLLAMFRRLHPEKSGWNLSLINIGVTNMAETAGNSRTASGRDIGNMFRRQDDVLKDFRITAFDSDGRDNLKTAPEVDPDLNLGSRKCRLSGEENNVDLERGLSSMDGDDGGAWDASSEDEIESGLEACHICGSRIPAFVLTAHLRYHEPA